MSGLSGSPSDVSSLPKSRESVLLAAPLTRSHANPVPGPGFKSDKGIKAARTVQARNTQEGVPRCVNLI